MSATSTNGVYLVSANGDRIPLKESALRAIKRMVESRENGEVVLQFKCGSNAGVTSRTVYSE
jgi:hypothetical protein